MGDDTEVGGTAERDDIRLLLVEDNPGDALLVGQALLESGAEGIGIRCVSTLRAALEVLREDGADVVLLDLGLPDSAGLATLAKLASHAPDLPIVVLSGVDDEELAVRAVRAKAQEYVPKAEVQGPRLMRAIRQAIERKRAHTDLAALVAELREASTRTRELITASADGILVLDSGGSILFANPAAAHLVGVEAEKLLGRVIHSAPAEGETIEVELQPDQVVEIRVVAIQWEHAPAYLATMRDITARRAAEAALKKLNSKLKANNSRLQRLAFADPLTGILNRPGLERVLANEIARSRRTSAPLSACLIECDGFGPIHAEHGLAVGDDALRAVSRKLEKTLRLSDHLARVGGNAFLALLPDTDLAEAEQITSRLRIAVREGPLEVPGTAARPSVAFGVALLPPSCASIEEAIAVTEAALRQGRDAGSPQP